ncbi:hypothetical protein TorRG33x02_264350 [Trema orientale]|uniref:Uncharacterized protein n=1 Tax=Trema orientale TaxID=63057 RepID=A0A2P5D2M7_TREOI|nr:hypothetical protein TorRG33x02_264350 [Trema orientale]
MGESLVLKREIELTTSISKWILGEEIGYITQSEMRYWREVMDGFEDFTRNDMVRSIIVPAQRALKGWEDFSSCLQSFFSKTGNQGRVDPSKTMGTNGISTWESRRGILQLKQQQTSNKTDAGTSYLKQYGDEDNRTNKRSIEVRNWRLAVVVFRDNVEIQWNVINTGLSNKLRRNVVLTELLADRAMVWCMNDAEKKIMLKFQTCFLFNTRLVRVVSWCQEHHWAEVKFAGRDIWIEVNGLPLDWWNDNVFQCIEEKLGGLTGGKGKREPTTGPDSDPIATEGVAAMERKSPGSDVAASAPPNNTTLGKSDHGYHDQHGHSAERRDHENLSKSSKRVGKEVSFGGHVGRDSSTGTEIAIMDNTSTQSRELVPFVRIKDMMPTELIGQEVEPINILFPIESAGPIFPFSNRRGALEFYNENYFSALSLEDDVKHLEEHWASAKAHRKDTTSHVNSQHHQNMDFQAHEDSNYFGQRTLGSVSREKPSLIEADSLNKNKSPKLLSDQEEDGNTGKEIRATSEPTRLLNKWVNGGKFLKRLIPKQRQAFVQGRIQRWMEFTTGGSKCRLNSSDILKCSSTDEEREAVCSSKPMVAKQIQGTGANLISSYSLYSSPTWSLSLA